MKKSCVVNVLKFHMKNQALERGFARANVKLDSLHLKVPLF